MIGYYAPSTQLLGPPQLLGLGEETQDSFWGRYKIHIISGTALALAAGGIAYAVLRNQQVRRY